VGTFSRDGKKEGYIFHQHINTHLTRIVILGKVYVPKESDEHQLGNFLCAFMFWNFIRFCISPKALTEATFFFVIKGVIEFCGMVTASFNCPMFVENLGSLTTDQCTVFSWLRLKLSAKGDGTWAYSALELRWKSSCHIIVMTVEK
jgi:hypothetical protein